jgi:cell division protein FtsW (lipid II flippase)
MIMGMTTPIFIHTLISLIGIASGLVVALGLLSANRAPGWTSLFLATTVLTSVTGFFLPADHFKPSHVVGIISLVVLAVTLYALYGRNLRGAWRWIYVGGATLALYFNVFVLVAQAFLKIQPLKDLAPTGSEPPFLIAQLVVLVAFIVIGIVAIVRFRPDAIMRI